jgi:hypothetical protein
MPTTTPNSQRFVTYTFVEDWPELSVAINELETRLRSSGRPLAADVLVRGYSTMRDELLLLGRDIALFGTKALRESEKKTRVRPDTLGGGGPRLGDALVAEAIDQNIMPGAVGIADMDILDADVPWWLTNEIGSHGRVGGRLYGVFYGQDDAGPPEASQFREHPLFQAGNTSGLAGVGFIERPIPARYFIAKAVPVIDTEWRGTFAGIKQRFESELARAIVTLR